MAEQGYLGSKRTWERVGKVVRHVERHGPVLNTDGVNGPPSGADVYHVKLTSAVDADNKPGYYFGRSISGAPNADGATAVAKLGGTVFGRDNAVVMILADVQAGTNSVTEFDDDTTASGASDQSISMASGESSATQPYILLVVSGGAAEPPPTAVGQVKQCLAFASADDFTVGYDFPVFVTVT